MAFSANPIGQSSLASAIALAYSLFILSMKNFSYQFLRKEGYCIQSKFICPDEVNYYKNLLDCNLNVYLSPHGIRNLPEIWV